MYITRKIETTVRRISLTFPVLMVTGPRQSGKTTMLNHLSGDGRKYVSLDDPSDRLFAKTEPSAFLERHSPPVIIDEIQYAPEILPYIKMYVDKHGTNGDFWLTGSQMFHMMKSASESLAGRVGVVNLFGLSNSEITGTLFDSFTAEGDELMKRLDSARRMTMPEVFGRIHAGSMPRVYVEPYPDLDEYYSSYVQTYLSRDVRDLTQVADELAFYRFLCIAAARTGALVNYEALAREAEISAPTAKQWLSVLASSGVIALIEPYRNNALKRVVKAPRMYFLDTGLAAHLTKWQNAAVMESGAMAGAFFETYAVSEIYKSFVNVGKRPPLYYYRDSNAKEIDLLIWRNGALFPIEIKKSANPTGAAKHFGVLGPVADDGNFDDMTRQLKMEIGAGCVVCLANDLRPIDNKNWYVPVWLI
jgi:predicted AAA+ superfamily ATPase